MQLSQSVGGYNQKQQLIIGLWLIHGVKNGVNKDFLK